MNKLRKKLISPGGFTLAETLIVVLILLMVTSVVAAGIPVAANALDNVVETSNAQLLLSTTMTALREELSTAQDIEVLAGSTSTVTYTNSLGLKSEIYLGDGGKTIMLKQYTSLTDTEGKVLPLASNETASKGRKTNTPALYTTYTGVTYVNGIVTFNGLAVKRMNNDKDLADSINYSIRVVGYAPNP